MLNGQGECHFPSKHVPNSWSYFEVEDSKRSPWSTRKALETPGWSRICKKILHYPISLMEFQMLLDYKHIWERHLSSLCIFPESLWRRTQIVICWSPTACQGHVNYTHDIWFYNKIFETILNIFTLWKNKLKIKYAVYLWLHSYRSGWARIIRIWCFS